MSRRELIDLLRQRARRLGDRPALTAVGPTGDQTVTWGALCRTVEAAAARAATEFRTEPRVLLAMDNGLPAMTALLGLAVAGVDIAVFEAAAAPLRDPASAFHATGARTLLVPGGERPESTAEYRVLACEELVEPRPPAELPDPPASAGVTILQATSGSTGEPRLARQPLANLLRGGVIYRDIYRLTGADTILAPVPAAHSFGMVGGLFATIAAGAHLYTVTRFSPRATRDAIESGATVLLGTPLLYELVARTVRPARSALRVALSSGGPLEAGVADRAGARLDTGVLQVYGSTETGLIASQRPRATPWPAGCVGTPAPGVELRLSPAADAEPGAELAVRTTTMFRGYLDDRPVSLDRQGFYATGDVARLDEDGNLHLLRRKESFINVGGRKVNPVRVRRLLQEHPAVLDSAVYGVAAVGGEEVHAAIVLADGGQVGPLLEHCRARLADYEVPHRVHVLPALPRTGMGKIDRGRLPGVRSAGSPAHPGRRP